MLLLLLSKVSVIISWPQFCTRRFLYLQCVLIPIAAVPVISFLVSYVRSPQLYHFLSVSTRTVVYLYLFPLVEHILTTLN